MVVMVVMCDLVAAAIVTVGIAAVVAILFLKYLMMMTQVEEMFYLPIQTLQKIMVVEQDGIN